MKRPAPTDAMAKRYAQLTRQLAQMGHILQGTILKREILRQDPKNPAKTKTYGPYYQWTWKHKGKTVTVNLTAPQARAYQKAIDNHRRLEKILHEMRDLSLQILQNKTPSVKKRKSKIQQELGLS